MYIGLLAKIKAKTSCIILLSYQPNSTADLAEQAGFDSACQHGPQKENSGIQKNFLSWFWVSMKFCLLPYRGCVSMGAGGAMAPMNTKSLKGRDLAKKCNNRSIFNTKVVK